MANLPHMDREAEGENSKRNSLTLKLLAIVFLIVLFLIPASMVQGLINERSNRQSQTIDEVSSSWGHAQSVAGPILVIPYTTFTGQNNTPVLRNIYVLPESLAVNSDIQTEIRSRGIYDVPVYTSDVIMSGKFTSPNLAELGVSANPIDWSRAYLVMGVPDMRGVEEQIALKWNNRDTQFNPGVKGDVVGSGVHAPVALDISDNNTTGRQYTFSIDLKLRGSKSMAFVPVAKETTVTMKADWAHPSFGGAFLPREHSISDSGFTASWQVLDLNRNLPSQWTSDSNIFIPFEQIAVNTNLDGMYYDKQYPTNANGTGSAVESGTFGVNFFVPGDLYQKTNRTAKYAIAVIALVFTMVFFMELTAKRKIHPVQYALIGFGLVVFYTLLLSLAEHIGFGWSYVVASIAIISMITLFAKSVFQNWTRALTTGGLLTAFYLFVYVLLQLQDFALLLGSIALFLILGVIMYISRRIDWYGAGKMYA